MGGKDFVLKLYGTYDHVTRVKPEDYVCGLETAFLPEEGYFVQEQSPDEVKHLILKFLNNHTLSGTFKIKIYYSMKKSINISKHNINIT